jgi:hypothetical protein
VRKVKCRQRIVAIDVKVGVDQSGQERETLRIDHFCTGGDRHGGSFADCDNLFAANDNDCIEHRGAAAAIDQGGADDGDEVVRGRLRHRVHFMKRLHDPIGLAASRLRKCASRHERRD